MLGHNGDIMGVLTLPVGEGFLSWSMDGTLRLWDRCGRVENLWNSPYGAISQVHRLKGRDRYMVVSNGHLMVLTLAKKR
jgi:hypothetical protein